MGIFSRFIEANSLTNGLDHANIRRKQTNGSLSAGLTAPNSHRVVSVEDCGVLTTELLSSRLLALLQA